MAGFFRLLGFAVLAILMLYALICISLFPFIIMQPHSHFQEDQKSHILADFFNSSCSMPGECMGGNGRFFFGVATAPGQVEDELNDSWLEFARGGDGKFPVRAWHNIPLPEERLRFWTEPDVEFNLAKEAGATVFRLGIDWGRIVISEPINGTEKAADLMAVEHYKWILQRAHDHGMQVMLTLFHHSIPKWALEYGGWSDRRTAVYFVDFARYAKEQFGEKVKYWVTFNEPHIFVLLTHCSGSWPGAWPGVPMRKLSTLQCLFCFSPFGGFGKAMKYISEAHIEAYNALHEGDSKIAVGVAHHVGVFKPFGLFDIPVALVSQWLIEFRWIDTIYDHLDFCGLNYYGQEIMSYAGLILSEDEEYSEAGRGVYPNGMYEVLVAFHRRYKARRPGLRYIITENGFADARDILRRPYLVEHLLAVHAALKEGVPIDGYLHWTIEDNLEWADGYCPKFGLVDVDRANNLTRHPRPSYYLYKQIATTGVVTQMQREKEWNTLVADARQGGVRPFCRKTDQFNRMWTESRDVPIMRPIVERDWRFGKYQNRSFWVYISRSIQVGMMFFYDTLTLFSGALVKNNALVELVGGEL